MAEWLSSLRLRLRAALRRRQLERDLADELQFHVALRESQLRMSGAANADTDARRRFGSAARIREELRDAWALAPRLSSLLQDLRYAARVLRRNTGFASVVILTLGFGIGINTATFSIVNAVLIRPLGFNAPERLVTLREELAGFGLGGEPFSPPDFLDVEREQQSFEGVAAYESTSLELSGTAAPIRVAAARVSANLFPLLGASPIIGRAFRQEEDRPGVDVAILSAGLWQSRFGGDTSIVGRTVTLDRRPFTIVGVMPPSFEFPLRGPQINNSPADVWVPLAFTDAQRQNRGNEFRFSVVGRLKDGVSMEEAQAELAVLTRRITDSYPPGLKSRGFSIDLSAAPLREEIAGRLERPLLLLFAAVGLVLLVTCANVANLVLSRAAGRAREVALRAALGSSRGRLLQLLLAEAALLSLGGGLLGILLSLIVVDFVPEAVADSLPAARAITMDLRVLVFSAGLTTVTALLFAMIPLFTVERGAPSRALQEEGARTTPGVRRHRIQAGLVVSTVGLACVLLVGAGLFVRSFRALMATDAGFNPDGVLTASLTLPRAGYATAPSVRAFHDALVTRASSLGGVRSAALVTDLPLESYERRTVSPEGVAPTNGAPRNTNISWVRGPFVQTLGIRLKSGRLFSDVEDAERRNVVIVNERLAAAFWPGQDVVGKRLRWGLDVPQNPSPWLTVVGVAADVVDGPLGHEPFLHAYEPFSQFPDIVLDNTPGPFGRHVKLAVRTDGDPRGLLSAVRAEIGRIDPHLAVDSIATMSDRIADVVAPRQFSAGMLAGFAVGSLVLASIGLYGLLAFSVGERRREIAVRLALGAEPVSILRMVIAQGLKLVGIGLGLGLLSAYGAAGAVASFLYRTESRDLVTFGMVPVVLLSIALIACALPAYRAARVVSLLALRSE